MKNRRSSNKLNLRSIPSVAVLTLLAAIVIYPFVMMVIVSLKTKANFMDDPLGLPRVWTLENYLVVFQKGDILTAFRNSLLITSLSLSGQILFGSLAAYALSKMNFKKSKLFSSAFLAPMIFPVYTVIIPLYLVFRRLGLVNNIFGLVLVYVASGLPLVIFILTSFMKTIPYQISESAFVAGASHFRVYYRIILPLIKPAIATTVVVSGLSIWNDFFLPMIMMTNRKLATLPLKVFLFVGQYNNVWTSICACLIILVVPILIVYVFLQSQIISGIVAGSVKG